MQLHVPSVAEGSFKLAGVRSIPSKPDSATAYPGGLVGLLRIVSSIGGSVQRSRPARERYQYLLLGEQGLQVVRLQSHLWEARYPQ